MKDNYGEYTKMITLPVGTKFFVVNGHWEGEIILKDGIKHIRVEGDKEYPIKDTDENVIEIQSKKTDDEVKDDIYTKLITLPSGTRFHVVNGNWEGIILDRDGVKYLKACLSGLECYLSDEYELIIKIHEPV